MNFMYSSEDLEIFYFQYQTEGFPNGVSIQDFCIWNKVPYNIFSKWYKDTRNKIVEVHVEGLPSGTVPALSSPVTKEPTSTALSVPPTRICVELRMSTGMHISQKNLSYQALMRMIEKLEVLC